MVTKRLLILPPIFLACVLALPASVRIAGLFDQDEMIPRTFKSSIGDVNRDRHDDEELSPIYLTSESRMVTTDPFEAHKKVCELLQRGIIGIFGPQDKTVGNHVQSICDTMEIPYISVRQESSQAFQPRGISLNLYPHVSSLSRLYNQIVTEFGWKSFAILYENVQGLMRLHLLLQRWEFHGHGTSVHHLGKGPNYRDAMQDIKESDHENIIIDCSYNILSEVLKQAQQVGILTNKYQVFVTSLDLQTLDLEPYQYSGVNFTGVRIIDPEDRVVQQIVERHKDEWSLSDSSQLMVEAALMYDAVQLFARAFKQLENAVNVDIKQLSCEGNDRWEHGLSLSNFMRSTETRGLTGLVKFDRDGFRSNIQLDIVYLTKKGLIKVGVWNSTAGNSIEWMSSVDSERKTELELSLQNKTFTVLISMTPPYGMQRKSLTKLKGNERYEGFAIDIINAISKILGFNYTLQVESDYGTLDKKTNQWSGMLGKLMADEADIAITDLTITAERAEAVDFTIPFMNLSKHTIYHFIGISILYKKPKKAPPSLFSFLLPFSKDVWIYLMGVYIIVSLLFFVIGRLSPAEWTNPYPCIEDAEVLENQFTFKNSFWFSIGSIMQQGSELAPIGISTRMLAGLWWFFCIVMVSSYTANLAAFLTIESPTSAFDNVEELASKETIKYGAKNKGSTISFFKDSNHTTYKKMYKYMKENENDVLLKDNDAGLKKIRDENYAYLMESSSLEYTTERNCDVKQVGDLLDEKGYGIAVKKFSPYRHLLNAALLKLSESGAITELKKEWWTRKHGGGKCQEEGSSNQADPLGLPNVGGVFLVLTIGVALSCVYTLLELLWDIAWKSFQEKVPFKQEVINEIKFIAKCSSSKPGRRRNGTSSSNSSDNGSTRGCTPPYGFVPTVITTSPSEDK